MYAGSLDNADCGNQSNIGHLRDIIGECLLVIWSPYWTGFARSTVVAIATFIAVIVDESTELESRIVFIVTAHDNFSVWSYM